MVLSSVRSVFQPLGRPLDWRIPRVFPDGALGGIAQQILVNEPPRHKDTNVPGFSLLFLVFVSCRLAFLESLCVP